MPVTRDIPATNRKILDPILEDFQKAIENTDWDDYWKKVGERVAREVDAYADARAKSWEDFNHRMLR